MIVRISKKNPGGILEKKMLVFYIDLKGEIHAGYDKRKMLRTFVMKRL